MRQLLNQYSRLGFSLALLALFCAPALAQDPDIEQLARWLSGSFDTFAQVAADETANTPYKHTRTILNVVPVKLKGLATDKQSRALYFEQAQAETPDKPYRSGVYLLTRVNGNLVNRVYRVKDSAKFAGAYRQPGLLKQLTAEQLTPVEGCELTFTKINDQLYRGAGGLGRTCKSSLRGATHTVVHGEYTPTATITLDQGFDDGGAHKWGPPPGTPGHIFIKRAER